MRKLVTRNQELEISKAAQTLFTSFYLLVSTRCGTAVHNMWQSLVETSDFTAGRPVRQRQPVGKTRSLRTVFTRPSTAVLHSFLNHFTAVFCFISPRSTVPIKTTTSYINNLLLVRHISGERFRFLAASYHPVRLRCGTRLSSRTALTLTVS